MLASILLLSVYYMSVNYGIPIMIMASSYDYARYLCTNLGSYHSVFQSRAEHKTGMRIQLHM